MMYDFTQNTAVEDMTCKASNNNPRTKTQTDFPGGGLTEICALFECIGVFCSLVWSKVTGRAAEDVVLFTGTGATAAVAKLVSALSLAGPLPPGSSPDDR